MSDEKKADRKCKRFAAKLKSSKGLNCSLTPGPNIALCNAGQATGLVKEEILSLLNDLPSVKLKKLVAEKGESHSFLMFDSKESASLFLQKYNGKRCLNNDTQLYMCYVDNIPDTEILCPHKNPAGLLLIEDFISVVEEKEFIELFDWEDIESLKNRQVKHFGYEFRYGTNDVDLNSPLPEKIPNECDVLWTRLKKYGIDLDPPDQLTVNKYLPGQGIPSHVDKHSPFGPTILSLSLGSSLVMDWKHHNGINIPIVIPARSMLVMQGEARYDWQHGIQPRTWDPVIEYRTLQDSQRVSVITSDTTNRQTRISLTFRWTRSGACDCSFKTLCDSSKRDTDLDDAVASNLEELHVHQVYEQIAGHFSSTRHKAWPRVLQFLRAAHF